MPGLLSGTLAWVVIGTFVVGTVTDRRGRELGRRVTTTAQVLFVLFWLQLIPRFTLIHKSYIGGLSITAAVSASLYAGQLLYNGRDILFVLLRTVAAMGIVYLPFETVPVFTFLGATVLAPCGILIGAVAAQARFLTESFGYTSQIIVGDQGYLNTFLWMQGSRRLGISVVLAYTGPGSIAIFAGLVAAANMPTGRKLRGLTIAVSIIHTLNLLQTTLIAISTGKQYFHLSVDEVLFLFGSSDPYMVSFFISDRVISQALAVVVLVRITYPAVHEVLELLTTTEDVLYTVTDDEHDLRDELGPD